ncbi:MAG: DNA polymerase III subunit gamma/tau [SAR202 cluster bacterium]|jgi:DNA polymerase-3 subunit gamma/tau|nr:MAG: DNA polymerase III subunit gamma/tau [SAR202 cluster bacterium]KAA1299085.1 MAG: DNA polymerase III subunit gamma/tau [SAR202 cluster bacterium]|tara:strand:- start:293 stop:1945 length:1653 start_codon:yes stop_codon:yes gene_type:complete
MTLKREVLYQKWRPRKFADVVGQDHITLTLKNSLLRDKYAHAYLFTGPRGTGKTSTARILAKALNTERDSQGEPLLDTEISLDIDSGKFLDLIEIDAASNRRIDDIRSLLENVQFMPSKGKYKVYIIDEVHMLTNEAFNALLKTLEEPPPQVIMILATTEIQKLPETIISRCQRYDFRNVSDSDIVSRLRHISDSETISCDDDLLWFIAQNSSGSLRDACNLLEQLSVAFEDLSIENARSLFGIMDENISLEIFNNIIKNDQENLIVLLQDLRVKGVDFRMLSSSIIDALRLGVFTSNGIITLEGYSKDHLLAVKKTFDGIPAKKLLSILEKLLSLISIRTESFDVLLESALIHLSYIFDVNNKKIEAPAIEVPENDKPLISDNSTQNISIKQSVNTSDPAKLESIEEIEKDSNTVQTEANIVTPEIHNSQEKDEWEKVLFDLRRVKFGKMVLGGLLRNVEIPKRIDDKLALKFKSKHLHDLFKAEWKIDLAREAVKNAVIKVYGDKIKLVLEEPEEEKKNNADGTNILDSSIVKSALAMGAKIEEEKEG